MLEIDGRTWITVRRSNLRYFDDVELYYRNPAGRVVLYKPAGMGFTDQALDGKPFLGELYIKPEDKIRALREAQRGFSSDLTSKIATGSVETMREIKSDLTAIVDETLCEPRSGSLRLMPDFVSTVVDGYSSRPDVIKYLARISHTDYTTAIHSINVMALTLGYCFYTGRDEHVSAEYGLAALLHDVGKVDVDPEILLAPRKLTDAEFEQMKRHPASGAEILSEYGEAMTTALEAALHHHLKLDGSGYPDAAAGPVSEIGRIISVVDTYEALTNDDRPYRSAMPPLDALRLIKEDVDAGRYDREVFAQFAYSLTDSGSRRSKQASPDVDRPEIGRIVGNA